MAPRWLNAFTTLNTAYAPRGISWERMNPCTPCTKVLAVLAAVVLFWGVGTATVHAEEVDWDALNLNDSQEQRIDMMENRWRQTYSRIKPLIDEDYKRLRVLLNSPNSNEQEIHMLQSRIRRNKERLAEEATHCFLSKKKVLNSSQQNQLQQMMSKPGY